IAGELGEAGVENVSDPNMGGTVEFDNVWVRLVPAWHTSTTPNGTANVPAGLVIGIGGKVVYHLGDTALMCIGGHYTMDRHDAVKAAELVGATTVIPCHYNTFPPVETDAGAFKADVEAQTSSKVELLEPGESFSL